MLTPISCVVMPGTATVHTTTTTVLLPRYDASRVSGQRGGEIGVHIDALGDVNDKAANHGAAIGAAALRCSALTAPFGVEALNHYY